ncbi:unknown [Candidatus Colimorpha enterica]|uniref:Uncharacterized protein n=1 Tax=Candidatus Colimorpha enterica TaxID=3083063 RepID=R6UZ18_9BACT|nr:unknown [Candidatus Colimorpha enterica]
MRTSQARAGCPHFFGFVRPSGAKIGCLGRGGTAENIICTGSDVRALSKGFAGSADEVRKM